MGAGSITHVEITAWANGMGIELLPFERQAIRQIDKAFLIYSNSKT